VTQGSIDLKIVTDRLDIVRASLAELRAFPVTDFPTFVADRRHI
jgi:hypothetical protein